MAAASGDDSLFRVTARGREPLSSPGQCGFHVDVVVLRRAGIGVITSVRGTGPIVRQRMTDLEYLSAISGIPVAKLVSKG